MKNGRLMSEWKRQYDPQSLMHVMPIIFYDLSKDVIAQLTRFSFDSHMLKIIERPFFGGQVVFTKYKAKIDCEYLVNKIKQFGIKTLSFVPSLAVEFVDNVMRMDCISDLISVEYVYVNCSNWTSFAQL